MSRAVTSPTSPSSARFDRDSEETWSDIVFSLVVSFIKETMCFSPRLTFPGTLLSLAALAYARYSLRRQRALANAVKGLTAQVLERLCQQAAAAQAKPGSELPAYLSSTRLRDYYLKQMPMAQRNAVWQRVSNAVEADSDVRVRQLELQGEIHRVWEWMGDVASPGFGSPAPLSPSPSMATMSDTSGWQVA